jgi:hypothetical protein
LDFAPALGLLVLASRYRGGPKIENQDAVFVALSVTGSHKNRASV